MKPFHLFVRADDPSHDLEANSVPYSELDTLYFDPFAGSPVTTTTPQTAACTSPPPRPPFSHFRGRSSPPRPQPHLAEPSLMTKLPEYSRFPQFSPTKQQVYSSPAKLETEQSYCPRRAYTITRRERDGSYHPVATTTQLAPGPSSPQPVSNPETPIVAEQDPLLPLAIDCIHSLCADAERPRSALTKHPVLPTPSPGIPTRFLNVPQITITDNTDRHSSSSSKTFYAFQEFGWLLEYIGADEPGSFPAMSASSKASFVEACAAEKLGMAVRSARAALALEGGGGGNGKGKILDRLQELQAFFSESTAHQQDGDGDTTMSEEGDLTLRGDENGRLDRSLLDDKSHNFSRPLRIDIPVSTPASVVYQGTDLPKDGRTDAFTPRLTQTFDTGGLDRSDVVQSKGFSFDPVEHPIDHEQDDSFISDPSAATGTLCTERPRRPRPPVPINSIRLSRWPSQVDPKYLSRPADWTPIKMQVAPAPFGPDTTAAVEHEDTARNGGERRWMGPAVRRKQKKEMMVRWMIVLGFIIPAFWIIGGWFVYPSDDTEPRRPRPGPNSRPRSNTRSHVRSTPHTSFDFETGTPFIPLTPNRSSYPFEESVSSPTALLGRQSVDRRDSEMGGMAPGTEGWTANESRGGNRRKEKWYTHKVPVVRYCRHAAIVGIPGETFAVIMLAILFVFV
ncbi:hypothetical protein IAR50_003694 [Cryptococcus sp. DSM 104548]